MCTSFKIKPLEQTVIVGRTMEFEVDLKSKISVFPRNFKYQGVAPNDKPGLSWEGKYGFVGMDTAGLECITDGLNEAGLYFGALYLPNFSAYQNVPEGQEQKAISQVFDVGKYLLSTCATTDDVKAAITSVIVWGTDLPGGIGRLDLHYTIHDADDKSVVIEYVNGQLQIHDNPLGVLTNSPPFDWHMLNLGNYVNLSANNVPDIKLTGYDAKAIGQGSGMIGLPGDFTPPSRFVRAVALTQSALPVQSDEEAELLAYHIVDSFDITKGLVRNNQNGKELYEYTQWLTLSDLKNRRYFIRYYDNPATLMVDLAKIDFAKPDITHLNTAANWFTDISATQA